MEYIPTKTITEALIYTCKNLPDSTAQRFNPDLYYGDNNGVFTYQEMRERIDAIACGLLSLGMERQTNVALMSASSPYWTHVDMALSMSAAVSVTIYPSLSINEVTYIVNDSKSKFLFVGTEDTLNMVLNDFDSMASLEKVICMDLKYTSSDDRVIGLTDLMNNGREWLKNNSSAYEARYTSVTEDDLYTILYTSGTTGQGKGVLLTHWCASSRMEGVRDYFKKYNMELTHEDVTLCFLPLSHIFDRGSCQLLALCQGATIAYADKAGTLLEDMQKYNPTWINCVPRLYEKIYITFQQQMAQSGLKKMLFDWAMKIGMKALEYRKNDNDTYNMHPDFDLLSKLPFFLKKKFKIADKLFSKVRSLFGNRFRYSFSASAGISPELLKFFYAMGFAVVEGYGSTESFNACILNPITACKPGFVGLDANGGISRIADDGELELSGAGMFKGYLNKPEENADSFTEDGWFKTGDLVLRDNDGYIKIVDRKKQIICTAVGKNIAPAKLENLFSTSINIEQVFFVGDERNFITALIVPNFNTFIELFKKENVSYNENSLKWNNATGVDICTEVGEDFVTQPKLKDLIDKDVAKANDQLESFERIKNYAIITSRFTEENGQLTPTQKTKKRVILDQYEKIIDAMYN